MGESSERIVLTVHAKAYPNLLRLTHYPFKYGILLSREASEAVNKYLRSAKILVLVQNPAKNIESTFVVKIILFNKCRISPVNKHNLSELIPEQGRLHLADCLLNKIGSDRELTEILDRFQHLNNNGWAVPVA